MGRRRAELLAGVEHPGQPDTIDPRALLDEWRLMHMAREHHVGPILLDPLPELDVAEMALAAPAGRRLRRRRVMNPDPAPGPLGRRLGQLRADPGPYDRPVPPRAHGEQCVLEREGLAIADDPRSLGAPEPLCDPLAGLVPGIEVVIAGTDKEQRFAAEPREVFPDDDALCPPVDHRTQVEMIPGHDHDIKVPRRVEDPVELRQRIMQVGYEKQSHDRSRVQFGSMAEFEWRARAAIKGSNL